MARYFWKFISILHVNKLLSAVNSRVICQRLIELQQLIFTAELMYKHKFSHSRNIQGSIHGEKYMRPWSIRQSREISDVNRVALTRVCTLGGTGQNSIWRRWGLPMINCPVIGQWIWIYWTQCHLSDFIQGCIFQAK